MNLCEKNGAGPLYIACHNGHKSTAQVLLNNGADVNLCKNNGAGPLYIACQNGHKSTAQLLLKNDADVNLCMEDGSTEPVLFILLVKMDIRALHSFYGRTAQT